jgi:hypothetical protein
MDRLQDSTKPHGKVATIAISKFYFIKIYLLLTAFVKILA